MILKCKPVWAFQSVEYEVEVDPKNPKDLAEAFDFYSSVLNKLMEIAPEQSKQVVQTVKMPSDAQKELMRKFGIPFTAQTTAKEAQELIQKSVDKAYK